MRATTEKVNFATTISTLMTSNLTQKQVLQKQFFYKTNFVTTICCLPKTYDMMLTLEDDIFCCLQ
jgi:hypothetical protein